MSDRLKPTHVLPLFERSRPDMPIAPMLPGFGQTHFFLNAGHTKSAMQILGPSAEGISLYEVPVEDTYTRRGRLEEDLDLFAIVSPETTGAITEIYALVDAVALADYMNNLQGRDSGPHILANFLSIIGQELGTSPRRLREDNKPNTAKAQEQNAQAIKKFYDSLQKNFLQQARNTYASVIESFEMRLNTCLS